MTAAIEIYTRPGCGYCSAAKSLLTRKNAAFIELNVATDPTLRQQMYDRAGAGSEAKVAQILRARAKHADPNRLMVRIGDDLLGRRGKYRADCGVRMGGE